MIIQTIERYWLKKSNNRPNTSSYYQSSTWKATVNRIWIRDKGMCQLCLEKGIKHFLERGTRDLSKQGTVDHKEQRKLSNNDSDDNLWLIGSNHHQGKSAFEGNQMRKT
jgi:5-methylcytosine-specific restriction endonuclease McrA